MHSHDQKWGAGGGRGYENSQNPILVSVILPASLTTLKDKWMSPRWKVLTFSTGPPPYLDQKQEQTIRWFYVHFARRCRRVKNEAHVKVLFRDLDSIFTLQFGSIIKQIDSKYQDQSFLYVPTT